MQFTPQQMSGGPKYGGKVMVGNWNEDRSRVEFESKDFELRKSRGQLATTHKARQRGIGMQTVPHSYHEDGVVRYGDTIMLRTTVKQADDSTSQWHLSNNIWDRVDFTKNTVCVTASSHDKPVARNTFVVARPYSKSTRATATYGSPSRGAFAAGAGGGGAGGGGAGSDDVLCYGDTFFLATNPSLRVDDRTGMVAQPYLLMSELSNTVVGAGRSASTQDVVMTLTPSSACGWKVVAASGDALATEGLPVRAGDDVMVVHCVTNQALAAPGDAQQDTDFGVEIDTHVRTYRATGVVSGDRLRAAMAPNRFSFVLASDPSAAVDTREFTPLTAEALIEKIRGIINERGHHAIRGLARSFRIMDDRGDGKLDREDFKWGLYDYGVHLSDEEFDLVLDFFDRDDDGTVSFDEFLRAVRGEMNERRLSFVHEAFRRLDKDGSGLVTLSDLVSVYDTSFHPDVKAGRMTHEECVTEFMSQWDTKDKDGIITLDELEDYYKDVSASIDDDDYFELMMRNAWHISGGEGWTENTTCRRVLVVHSDGTQEIVEVKDDLGFDATDIEATKARLEAQGVEDIAAVRLYE